MKVLLVTLFVVVGFIFLSVNNPNYIAAATRTWDGSSSVNWSDSANWDTLPTDGDDLVFPAAPGGFTTGLNCTFGTTVFQTITFNDNYTVSCPNLFVSSNIDLVTANNVTITSTITAMTHLFFNSVGNGALTTSGTIDMNGNALTMSSNSGSTMLINSTITGTGSEIQVSGSGDIHFGGTANSFVAPINLTGNLTLDSVAATGPGNTLTTLGFFVPPILKSNINGSVDTGTNLVIGSNATWDLNGFDESPESVTDQGIIIVDTGSNLTLGGSGGTFTSDNIYQGAGDILKAGVGTVTLTRDSTFSGLATVQTGTLIVNADFSTTDVNITSGGILGGSGRINNLTNYTGSVSPGSGSTDTLTVNGNTSLNTGTPLVIDIDSIAPGDYDVLATAGTAFITDAVLNINLGYVALPTDTFTILTATSIVGTFNGLPEGSIIIAAGRPLMIHYSGSEVRLTVASVGLSNSSFTSDPAVPTAGQPFTITSVWTGSGPTPTGTAELFNGSTSLGTVSLVGGVATFNVAGLPEGTFNLTVQYSGDLNFAGAISSPLSLTVAAAALPNTGINLPVGLMGLGLIFSLGGVVGVKKKW